MKGKSWKLFLLLFSIHASMFLIPDLWPWALFPVVIYFFALSFPLSETKEKPLTSSSLLSDGLGHSLPAPCCVLSHPYCSFFISCLSPAIKFQPAENPKLSSLYHLPSSSLLLHRFLSN